jgi:hypothetical protein
MVILVCFKVKFININLKYSSTKVVFYFRLKYYCTA